MNVLVADSGSTKTEWCYKNDKGINKKFHTDGLNPFYHTPESIRKIINFSIRPEIPGQKLDALYFYGAGCSLPEKRKLLNDAFAETFPDTLIEVYDDLLGAARAICGSNPGIACIIGTGSNSCEYNGSKIIDNIPSLGFVLGDEGSGGYIGKKIIRSYFYREIPEEIASYMDKTFNMDRKVVLELIYHGPQPNRYVASFTNLTSEFKDHAFIRDIIKQGFEEFVSAQVMKYTNHQTYAIGFVGSVVYYHQEIMKSILDSYSLKTGTFIKQPIDNLIHYHKS